jgi:hypothetical protein
MDLDNRNVLKVNDAVYYATWTEYFTSLVLHNLFFPNKAYSLVGFAEDGANLKYPSGKTPIGSVISSN